MRINRQYYRNVLGSVVIVVAGLAVAFKILNPVSAVSENYFVPVMSILCAFFCLLGVVGLVVRFNTIKFRRKFIYSFFAVANFLVGGLSIFFAIRYKTEGLLALAIYIFSFLVGIILLADIFFGKRNSKFEQEVLIY
ncbi:MAG: hypothetical protein JST47_11780 [Bacteroidetes bacterium]|nr:hypothetical protein [Bacteroidota bacterium]